MGRRVLRAGVDQEGTLNVLAFVHCSNMTAGGLSVVLINTDLAHDVTVTFARDAFRGKRVE